jgi:hypothetical protein
MVRKHAYPSRLDDARVDHAFRRAADDVRRERRAAAGLPAASGEPLHVKVAPTDSGGHELTAPFGIVWQNDDGSTSSLTPEEFQQVRPASASGHHPRHISFEQGHTWVDGEMVARAQRVPALNRLAAVAAARSAPADRLDGKYASFADMVRTIHTDRARAAKIQAAAGMSERVPSEGGFVVGESLRQDLLLLSLEPAIIRPRATVLPAGTLRTSIPVIDDTDHSAGTVLGGLEWEWAEEETSLTGLTSTFGRVTFEARKLAAYCALPSELWQDADQLDAYLRTAVPASLAWAEDQAFIQGSGAGQPQGLMSAQCALQVDRAAESTVGFGDLVNMIDRMLPQSLSSFIWLASPDALKPLLSVYLGIGTPSDTAVPPSEWLRFDHDLGCWTLLGRPAFFTEHVNALGETGDVVAVDPAYYVIADRRQMQVDTAVAGATFITDELELRITSRLDGRIWGPSEPVTPANSSETVSPVVILNATS